MFEGRFPRFAVVAPLAVILCTFGCVSNQFTRAADRAAAARSKGTGGPSPATVQATRAQAADDGSSAPVQALTVNDDTISVDDILKPIRKDLERRREIMSASEYSDYLVGAIQSRVRSAAREALLYDEASRDITEEEYTYIDGIVDQELRKRVNAEFSGRQTRFERALAEEGLTVADEREALRRRLIIIRWLQIKVNPKIADPTRDELWRIYLSQRDALVTPPRREMLIIEVGVRDETAAFVGGQPSPQEQALAGREAAKQSAETALNELRAGAEFSDVAEKYSTGWHKSNGGRWGWVARDGVREHLQPAVDALFALPEAGISSGVIETSDAFYIVQAAAIDAGSDPDFADIQPSLIERYRDGQFNKIVDEHVARLQRQAHIRPSNIERFLQAVAMAAPQPGGPAQATP